jgi:hypothetical protein
MMAKAKPNLKNREFQELKEIVTEYEDIFAEDSEDYGRTKKVYHRIDTGDARPIRQPPRKPLTKQTEVHGVFKKYRTVGRQKYIY